MKVLKIEPGKVPERIDVDNELASLQSIVGGYIEVLYPDARRPVGLICNEEPRTEPGLVQERQALRHHCRHVPGGGPLGRGLHRPAGGRCGLF